MSESRDDDLEVARSAFEHHDWLTASDLLWDADQRSPLEPSDLEILAESARWARQHDRSLDALERAESRYERQGAQCDAARIGLALCEEFFNRSRFGEAAAWLSRSQRLLESAPECSAHGRLSWMLGRAAWASDDLGAALSFARETTAIGQRLGDVDLQTMGLHDEGHVLLANGDVETGRALIDESAILASGATRSTAGHIYCGAIFAYRNMADWKRASEWTDASLRWCERESVSGFPGLCRFHRAEVRRLHGQLADAEQDALDAVDELLPGNSQAAAWGLAELGEIRRRRGDRAGARQALRRAHELGGTPQPSFGLFLLDEGKPDEGLASISSALDALVGVEREDRAPILPAAVTIAVAAGRLDTAEAFAAELDAWADACATTGTAAAATGARAELALAAGDIDEAVTLARASCNLWCELDAPFEAARMRMLLATALRLADPNDSNAINELETALSTFERLGATSEIQRAVAALHTSRNTRARPTLMFTDIVDSTRLVELLGDDAWSTVLAWHDRTLRRCFEAEAGRELSHEGDGFFVAFTDPATAVDCAIAIQHHLAAHRTEHGFAPDVRIGIHEADAIDLGNDYLGKGVHEAARIGAAAHGGEILVSRTVLDALDDRYAAAGVRELHLKGLTGPIEVGRVDWLDTKPPASP